MMNRPNFNHFFLKACQVILLAWCLLSLFQFSLKIKDSFFEEPITFNEESQWESIFGKELYSFLQEVKLSLPEKAKIKLVTDLRPFLKQRILFYLFPMRLTETPEYFLVYDKEGFEYDPALFEVIFQSEKQVLLRKK